MRFKFRTFILLVSFFGLFSCRYSNVGKYEKCNSSFSYKEIGSYVGDMASTEPIDEQTDVEPMYRTNSTGRIYTEQIDKALIHASIDMKRQLPDSVEFVIEQNILTSPVTKVSLSIINNTESNVYTGYHYTIERLIDGKWKRCQRKYLTVIDDVGIRISPGATYSFSMDISNVKDGYNTGIYRICKSIEIDKMEKTIFCVFYVE